MSNLCVIPTPWGNAHLYYTEQGVCGFDLPRERQSPKETSAHPDWVLALKAEIASYFQGQEVDFSTCVLDIQSSPFFERVYNTVQKIPYGQTLTYGDVARLAGSPKAARAVGQAMAKNPVALLIPCHRVVSPGTLGGFSSTGGVETKARMLALEKSRF